MDKSDFHDKRRLFASVGGLQGTFQPSADGDDTGILLLDDGTRLAAHAHIKVRRHISKQSLPLDRSYLWLVYPQTRFNGDLFKATLMGIAANNSALPDQFILRGIINQQIPEEEKVIVKIERNFSPPPGKERYPTWKPQYPVLKGKLDRWAGGQFWEFQVLRQGMKLAIEEAQLVDDRGYPGARFSAGRSSKPKTPPPSEPSDSPKTPAVAVSAAPAPQEIPIAPRASTPQLPILKLVKQSAVALPDGETPTPSPLKAEEEMPVSGKLEVTLKINEFPVDVETVENNWKHFEVDCGGRIVSVTVKPKIFKKLEQARENYPEWVAAISGQMGELTPAGFVLEQPSIQVFEKKAKPPKEEAVARE